jgi:aminoglycoside 6'-N-acetyltransferase I
MPSSPIITLTDAHTVTDALRQQMAEMLVAGFRDHWPDAWPTLEDAHEEVQEMLAPERLCCVALGVAGEAVGWIGGIPEYDGNVWELHPLVVRPDQQGRGVGRALVAHFEAQVAARGGLTIRVGTDDEDGMTSLANTDLYDDLYRKLATIRNLRRHPFAFYQQLGYTLVGVIPDANGIGKPDLLMAKRVSKT